LWKSSSEQSPVSGPAVERPVAVADRESDRELSASEREGADIGSAKSPGIDLQGAIVDPDTWTISGDFVAQSGIDERQVELVNERLQGAVIALNELEFDHMKVVERTERRIH